MQEIKNLEEKKINYERENNQISTEIHEGNRDLHVSSSLYLLLFYFLLFYLIHYSVGKSNTTNNH